MVSPGYHETHWWWRGKGCACVCVRQRERSEASLQLFTAPIFTFSTHLQQVENLHFSVIALVEPSGYGRSASKPHLDLAAEKASRRQRQRRDKRLLQQAELYDLHESLDKRIANGYCFTETWRLNLVCQVCIWEKSLSHSWNEPVREALAERLWSDFFSDYIPPAG